MKHRASKPNGSILWALATSAALAAACGGRAVTIEDGDAGGSAVAASGTTGTVSVAGHGGSGGTNAGGAGNRGGSAGSNSGGSASGGIGGVSQAGSSSAGAGNNCGVSACQPITCSPDESATTPPGGCCPMCQPTCVAVPCPPIACASGQTLQTLPGSCCPSCVPNSTLDCASGQKQYFADEANLLEKYSYGCVTAADCVEISLSNACQIGCGFVPVWIEVANDFVMNMNREAATECTNCGMLPLPPKCVPPPPIACVAGKCM